MAGHRKISPLSSHRKKNSDSGTLCRTRLHSRGSNGMNPKVSIRKKRFKRAGYLYSISGNPGALGGMFLSEVHDRLPGTWYDRTDAVNALRANEAQLGMTKFADTDFRRLAQRTQTNLKSPNSVDADVHFEKTGVVENIQVRGRQGTRRFSFDLKAAEAIRVPKNANALKPLFDAISALIKLVLEVR